MQGRLLPKYEGRYQAHPIGYWQQEFFIAKTLGLDCIEFILDYNDSEKNPLLSQTGCDQIKQLSKETGVGVVSVCADYFMQAPLHSDNVLEAERSGIILNRLLEHAAQLGVRDVVIPCVDESSLGEQKAIDQFEARLARHLDLAESCQVNMSLETDLNPSSFAALLERLDHPRVTVNYDIGNSASLGYDYKEELDAYGIRISDIHIKDRKRSGGSVPLGTGDANIPGFFRKLSQFNYSGPFIMQTYRDDEGVEVFKRQLAWFKEKVGVII